VILKRKETIAGRTSGQGLNLGDRNREGFAAFFGTGFAGLSCRLLFTANMFFRTGPDQRRKSAVVRCDKPPRKNESDKRKTNHVKKTPHNFQPTPHFARRNRDFCMENHDGLKRDNSTADSNAFMLCGLRLNFEQPSRGIIFVIRNEWMIVGIFNRLISAPIRAVDSGLIQSLQDNPTSNFSR